MQIRRSHYSTALSQAQGLIPESLALFEVWEEGQSAQEVLASAQGVNLLGHETENRTESVVLEGFGSRFLRPPHQSAALSVKRTLATASAALAKELIWLYAVRQHGIFFGFMSEVYWPALRAGRPNIEKADILSLIDRGRISGRLERDWSNSVRSRVASYVLGISRDFDLLSKAKEGSLIIPWHPSEGLCLYIAYDLHFLGLSDDEVVGADDWLAIGFDRSDVMLYLGRLADVGHMDVQDSGSVCRIDWRYTTRDQLSDALVRG